jgi:hypothetical protein
VGTVLLKTYWTVVLYTFVVETNNGAQCPKQHEEDRGWFSTAFFHNEQKTNSAAFSPQANYTE